MKERSSIYAICALVIAGLFQSACYYDIEDELYPNGCNTTNVSYNDNIVLILDRYACSSCHDSQSQQGGVNLDGYENILNYIDNGRLMGSIRHEPGYEPMPLGGARMSNCDISKFQAWIDAGAPNN